MCLIFISFHHHPTYKLIVAGNRDEFYNRPTVAAHFWEDRPAVLAGRDLEAGGTWLGVNRTGMISMLTNYRDPKNIDPAAPSRGHLVSGYLEGSAPPLKYLETLQTNGKQYNGFNLIVGNQHELWYYSNYKQGIQQLTPGFYGISNKLLETPWPKILRGKEKLGPILSNPIIDPETVFEVLYDDLKAPYDQLPETGLTMERESALSSMFIKTENYGSRCSTVVLVDNNDKLLFSERVYDTTTFRHQTKTYEFSLEGFSPL